MSIEDAQRYYRECRKEWLVAVAEIGDAEKRADAFQQKLSEARRLLIEAKERAKKEKP